MSLVSTLAKMAIGITVTKSISGGGFWTTNVFAAVLIIGVFLPNAPMAQATTVLRDDPHLVREGCLLDGNHLSDGNQLQFAQINWTTLGTRKDFEDCALAVAIELHDADLMKVWLQENGFIIHTNMMSESVMFAAHNIRGAGTDVVGSMYKGNIRLMLGLIDRLVVHSLAIGILFDAEGNALRANAVLSRE